MGFFRGQLRKTVFLMEKHVFVFFAFLCNFAKYKEMCRGEGVADAISESLWFFSFFNFLVIRDFEDEFIRESMIVEFV